MKQYLVTAIIIVIVTFILIVINELTTGVFNADYGFLVIIAAVLAGVWLGTRIKR